MKPGSPLPHLKAFAICPFSEPYQSSPCLPIPHLEIHFNTTLPSTPRSLSDLFAAVLFTKNTVCSSSVSHTCHTFCPSHFSLFDHPKNLVRIKIYKSPRYVVFFTAPSQAKISSSAPYFRSPYICYLPSYQGPGFIPIQNDRQNNNSVILIFIFFDNKLEDKNSAPNEVGSP